MSSDANLIRSINCNIWICKDEKITYFDDIDDDSNNLLTEIKTATDKIKEKMQKKTYQRDFSGKKEEPTKDNAIAKLFAKRRKRKHTKEKNYYIKLNFI